MSQIIPYLWFENQAEEAANFYVSVFKNSRIENISRYGEAGPGPAGSAMVVEYGPVQIGGKTFICPRRGVTISRQRTVRELHEWDTSFVVYAPFETMVNDFRFTEFHKFGSESRMLAGFEEVPDPGIDGGKQPVKPQ